MIEFEGCIFDFENMDGHDRQGKSFILEKKGNIFYWNYSCMWYGQVTAWPNGGTWVYALGSYEMAKKVYEQYEHWIIEGILLCSE